jgi:signal transduction histidine kinase
MHNLRITKLNMLHNKLWGLQNRYYFAIMCLWFTASVFYLGINHFILATVSLVATVLFFITFLFYNTTKSGPSNNYTNLILPTILFIYAQLAGESTLAHLHFLHIPLSAFFISKRKKGDEVISAVAIKPIYINMALLLASIVFFEFSIITPALQPELISVHQKFHICIFIVLSVFFMHAFSNLLEANTKAFDEGMLEESQKLWEYKINQSGQIKALGADLVRSFASGIAHEINNPLAVLRGASGQLQLKDISEKRKGKLVDMISRSSSRIDACVSTLSFLSQNHRDIDKKKLLLQDACTYLKERVNKVVCLNSENVIVRLHSNHTNPIVSLALLENTILPLVKNSIEAYEIGEIPVIKVEVRQEGQFELIVQVIDYGKGIDEQQVNKIFLPFETTKSSAGHNGLGLTSVNYIINQLGGGVKLIHKKHPTTFELSFRI